MHVINHPRNDRGDPHDHTATSIVAASIAAALALVAAPAIVWSWPPQIVGGALQILGIVLALLGVASVQSWLAKTAIEARHGLDLLWARCRRSLVDRWARLRGRPVVHLRGASLAATSDIAATLTVERPRVDRAAVSDGEWLALLDDRVESLFGRIDQADRARGQDREDAGRRLEDQRNELRAEIRRETRQGWQLIVAGLAWSLIGTFVGMVG
ncbi:MAG: hypothetical protein ACRDKY_02730 [Solirubrobacteraceae bacterium]